MIGRVEHVGELGQAGQVVRETRHQRLADLGHERRLQGRTAHVSLDDHDGIPRLGDCAGEVEHGRALTFRFRRADDGHRTQRLPRPHEVEIGPQHPVGLLVELSRAAVARERNLGQDRHPGDLGQLLGGVHAPVQDRGEQGERGPDYEPEDARQHRVERGSRARRLRGEDRSVGQRYRRPLRPAELGARVVGHGLRIGVGQDLRAAGFVPYRGDLEQLGLGHILDSDALLDLPAGGLEGEHGGHSPGHVLALDHIAVGAGEHLPGLDRVEALRVLGLGDPHRGRGLVLLLEDHLGEKGGHADEDQHRRNQNVFVAPKGRQRCLPHRGRVTEGLPAAVL
jgi:hypothetical protein